MPLYQPVPDPDVDEEDESHLPPYKRKGPQGPPADMERFLSKPPKPPRSCPEGTSLWLLGRHLACEHIAVFARWLRDGKFKHLTYLNFGYNKVGGEGMKQVCEALADGACPELTHFACADNPIGDMGAIALAGALRGMPKLTSIEINRNEFGDAGAEAIFAAASEGAFSSLVALYIKGNLFGDAGMEAMCNAWASGNFAAEHVLMGENCVGDEGMLCLANAIEAGSLAKVRHINLSPSPLVGVDGREVVDDIIAEMEGGDYKHNRLQVVF